MAKGVAKGVDYYVYSDAADMLTDVAVPKDGRTHGPEDSFKRWNLQVQSRNIPNITKYVGGLEWVTRVRGVDMIRHKQDISSLDGKLWDGTMGNMFNTPPRIGSPTVCWGFYDAGPGKASGFSKLTNQNQLYIYATRDQRRWMTELAARNPAIARNPFSHFALPGAHDAGMFDMRAVMTMLNSARLYAALLGSLALIPVVGPFIAAAGVIGRSFAPRALANLSMTQKDDVRTMLDIGTRFFDFRPGTMHPRLKAFSPGVRFHQHGVVPGYPYIAFLEDVLRWLAANPGEIVVVNANTAGFSDDSMKPSAAEVEGDLATAINNTGVKDIQIGLKNHLPLSYQELISTNRRLFFLNQIEGETTRHDSWSGTYGTLTPEPIIKTLEGMGQNIPVADYTVMQMQATATNIGSGVIEPAIFTTSDASSPLLATKAVMDIATNPWLRTHAAHRVPFDRLLVLLNDFVDNCMVETAIMVTEQRAVRAAAPQPRPRPPVRPSPRPPLPAGVLPTRGRGGRPGRG